MNVFLRVDPPNIIPWLSTQKKDENILLLDLEADHENDGSLRLDLNVVFNPISVRRGIATLVDYYVGCTGAEISIELTRGAIRSHTQAATLDVSYNNTTKTQRTAKLCLSPAVKTKTGISESDVTVGEITYDTAAERFFTSTFASQERYLSPALMGNTIKWTITIPRGEKAIRDFLHGNLYLFAQGSWDRFPRSGCVSIRPSDVLFFDSDRRPIGSLRSLLMWYILWENNIKVENKDGFYIKFEETVS